MMAMRIIALILFIFSSVVITTTPFITNVNFLVLFIYKSTSCINEFKTDIFNPKCLLDFRNFYKRLMITF